MWVYFTVHVFLGKCALTTTVFFVINWNKVVNVRGNQTDIDYFQSGNLCHHVECMKNDGCHYFLHDLLETLVNKRALTSVMKKVATLQCYTGQTGAFWEIQALILLYLLTAFVKFRSCFLVFKIILRQVVLPFTVSFDSLTLQLQRSDCKFSPLAATHLLVT